MGWAWIGSTRRSGDAGQQEPSLHAWAAECSTFGERDCLPEGAISV